MQESEKNNILTNLLGPGWKNGKETLYRCPKCNHSKKKLSVNIHKDVFKCWVCDYSGKSISKLIRTYGPHMMKEWGSLHAPDLTGSFDIEVAFNPPEIKLPELELPESYQILKKQPLHRKALKYLQSRDINYIDAIRWKIGYCNTGPFAERVIIPSFDKEGKLNYFVARSVSKKSWPKYKNPAATKDIIFNEYMINWKKPVTLVEGVFDSMKTPNSIPILGSTLKENSKLINTLNKKRPKIILALDADAYEKSLKIYKLLSEIDLNVKFLKMTNKRDLGDMKRSEVKNLMNTVTDINSDNYLLYEINKIK